MNIGASVENFRIFDILKLAISFNVMLELMILCLRNIYIQVSNYICIYYTICAVSFYYLWYGTMYKRHYNDKTLTLLKIYAYASELILNFAFFT